MTANGVCQGRLGRPHVRWAALLIAGCAMLSRAEVWVEGQTVPAGWNAAGTDPEGYEVGADTVSPHGGTRSGSVRWTERARPGLFATLMQTVKADSYRGKRLRLSAYVRTENVEEYAGVWMRLDGPERMVGFDNMTERPIVGTRDWRRYSIVLDVPVGTVAVAFGINLSGHGRVWIDDCVMDFVDTKVPVTGVATEVLLRAPARPLPPMRDLRDAPVNLEFEK